MLVLLALPFLAEWTRLLHLGNCVRSLLLLSMIYEIEEGVCTLASSCGLEITLYWLALIDVETAVQ